MNSTYNNSTGYDLWNEEFDIDFGVLLVVTSLIVILCLLAGAGQQCNQ